MNVSKLNGDDPRPSLMHLGHRLRATRDAVISEVRKVAVT